MNEWRVKFVANSFLFNWLSCSLSNIVTLAGYLEVYLQYDLLRTPCQIPAHIFLSRAKTQPEPIINAPSSSTHSSHTLSLISSSSRKIYFDQQLRIRVNNIYATDQFLSQHFQSQFPSPIPNQNSQSHHQGGGSSATPTSGSLGHHVWQGV